MPSLVATFGTAPVVPHGKSGLLPFLFGRAPNIRPDYQMHRPGPVTFLKMIK